MFTTAFHRWLVAGLALLILPTLIGEAHARRPFLRIGGWYGVVVGGGHGVRIGGPYGVQVGGGYGARIGGPSGLWIGGGHDGHVHGAQPDQFHDGDIVPPPVDDQPVPPPPPEAAAPPDDAQALTSIHYPKDAKENLSCNCSGVVIVLVPGQTLRFPGDRPLVVRFERGSGKGTANYDLQPGHYEFRQTPGGWDLLKTKQNDARAEEIPPPPRP